MASSAQTALAPATNGATNGAAAAPKSTGSPASSSSPLFHKRTIVTLSDGRQLHGRIASFDGSGNILMQSATELKKFVSPIDKEEMVTQRSIGAMVVPFKHIVSLHQKDEPLTAAPAEPPAQLAAAVAAAQGGAATTTA